MQLRDAFKPEDWQEAAVKAWCSSTHPTRGPYHGILHVYTGAGKTVLAAAAMVEAKQQRPETKFAIVVPTEALATQWVAILPRMTTIEVNRVGQVRGGQTATFEDHDILVFVLATARQVQNHVSRIARVSKGHMVMLVVDECHKAGARSSKAIFDVQTWARLGLSATPQREDAEHVDILGRPVPVEQQPHGREIGPVCYIRDIEMGIREGCLPRFEIFHHAVGLTPEERSTYDNEHQNTILQRMNSIKTLGGNPQLYQSYITGRIASDARLREAALQLQQAYFARKQFLYTASERLRVASLIMEDAFAQERPLQSALIFNERVGEAADNPDDDPGPYGAEPLAKHLRAASKEGMFPFDPEAIAIEHSRLSRDEREAAIEGLRTGHVRILVSVKALQEGLDIPNVEMGLSLASTASGRQRIQTMGRILRPARDPATGHRLDREQAPPKQLHFIYVKDSPDEELYRKESWGDLFTAANNHWRRWDVGADESNVGIPLKPPLTEHEAWEQIKAGPFPATWPGPQVGVTISLTTGDVQILGAGTAVANAAQLGDLLRSMGVPHGRLKITPMLGIVLKWGPQGMDGTRPMLAWGRVTLETTAGLELPAEIHGATLQEHTAIHAPADSDTQNSFDTTLVRQLRQNDFSGRWYEIVQQACLGWINDDQLLFLDAVDVLQSRGGRSRLGRALLEALMQRPTTFEVAGNELNLAEALNVNVRQLGNQELVVLGGAAVAMGRPDFARSIATEFDRRGNPYQQALANALRILVGDTSTILWFDGED